MARIGKFRPGAVGVALAMYDVWRRLPPRQRKQLMQLARTHGPTVARRLIEAQRRRRRY